MVGIYQLKVSDQHGPPTVPVPFPNCWWMYGKCVSVCMEGIQHSSKIKPTSGEWKEGVGGGGCSEGGRTGKALCSSGTSSCCRIQKGSTLCVNLVAELRSACPFGSLCCVLVVPAVPAVVAVVVVGVVSSSDRNHSNSEGEILICD